MGDLTSRVRQRTPRFIVLALLILALSPITTPFASCDLIGLLSGSGASTGAVLQAKPAPDQPTIAVDRGPDVQTLAGISRHSPDRRTSPVPKYGPPPAQLRI